MRFTSSVDAENYGAHLLTGRRVRLRSVRDEDLAVLARWWADPRIGANQMTFVMPTSEASARTMFADWSDNRPSRSTVGLSIETLADAPGLVGHVTLFDIDFVRGKAVLAIGLGYEHQGHGYGSDATRVMLRYAFTELGLHRVELEVNAYNDRALAAYRRSGFVEEGRRRESVVHDGERYDEVLMGVIAPDWRAAQRA